MLGVGGWVFLFCLGFGFGGGFVVWFFFGLVFLLVFFKVCLMQDSGILRTILYYLELLIVVLSK